MRTTRATRATSATVERRLRALAGLLAVLLAETERDLADARAGRLFYEWDPRTGRMRLRRRDKPMRAAHWPPCGARTRAGGQCRLRCVPGKGRCRMHGGLSTGPDVGPGARGDRGVEPAPGRGQEGGAGGRRLTPEARALPGPRPGR